MDEADVNDITERIIGCAFTVSNVLGIGFIEKVYENALVIELRNKGLKVVQQAPLDVRYDDQRVGEFNADLLVEDLIIVELKAVKSLDSAHFAQTINYLRAANLRLALLINFGTPRVQIKRIINN